MGVRDYIQTFIQRKGIWILVANGITKVLGFVSVMIVTRLTTESDFGMYSYAFNIVSALVPFMGFGAYQAFLRYSVEARGQVEKKELYRYAFGRGVLFSGILVLLLVIFAPRICNDLPDSESSFRIVAFVILTTLLMEYVKSYARAIHLNAISARIDAYYAVILLILTGVLTYTFGVLGYAVAVAAAPLLAILFFVKKMRLLELQWKPLRGNSKAFWSYGVYTTLGALLAQLFYAVDLFMIGSYVGDDATEVAIYRIAVIIPIATLVLPVSVAATDFVRNAQRADDKGALKNYVLNYWKTFGFLSLIVLSTISLLAPHLLSIFGENYMAGADIMRIYLIGSLGAHLLRVPFGNLLSAVGKASLNTYINAIVLVFTILLCGVLLPLYDIKGAAIAMAIMTWMSGILNAGAFWWYWRGLQGNF
jgi:O-antigen/teichoic acid export membrane protein